MNKAEYERAVKLAKYCAKDKGYTMTIGEADMLAACFLAANKVVEAARSIQQWDMLNPPRPEICADLPWLKRMIDEALRELDQGKA